MYWATSYFFYLGQKRDCPELLSAIDNISFSDERYRILKILNGGGFLLAAYLTPYWQIRKSVTASFEDAADLLAQLADKKSDSPLQQLPFVQVLCVFTKILCDTFSYEFFDDALTDRCYQIATQKMPTETNYIELFLLNSVRASLNENTAYDTLIQDYGKRIPLSIQIGIVEHSKDVGLTSKVVSKFSKKFHKSLKSNPSLRQSVVDLYEKPLRPISESKSKDARKLA